MSKYVIMLLVALGLTVLGGFLMTQYGEAKYKEGYALAKSEQKDAIVKASNASSKNLERIRLRENQLSDENISAGLALLGIMRKPEDR